jgi:hypothetical protein
MAQQNAPSGANTHLGHATQCDHFGEHAVRVGSYEVHAGGTKYFQLNDFDGFDLIIPLTNGSAPFKFGKEYRVLSGVLVDFGGVPEGWKEFLEKVIEELKSGRKILAFCVGSHGRTGCFLASLIALLESAEETPDPIQAVRERHCHHAVETLAQAEAIFALRGAPLPEVYRREFLAKAAAKQPQPSKKKP